MIFVNGILSYNYECIGSIVNRSGPLYTKEHGVVSIDSYAL